MAIRLLLASVLFFGPVASFADDVMFEGYYRVRLDGDHVGYAVQRFDFDPKSGEFTCRQFLRVQIGDDLIQESTRARANDKFEPLSYQYTYQRGAELKKIEGTFKGREMKLAIADGESAVRTETATIPERAILSSFLLYKIMQKPLKPGPGWSFNAIAEEIGSILPGKVRVLTERKVAGRTRFKVEVAFKDETLEWELVAEGDPTRPHAFTKGEVFKTESIEKGFRLDLVPRASLATANQLVPGKTLVTVFGNVPSGKVNMAAGASVIDL